MIKTFPMCCFETYDNSACIDAQSTVKLNFYGSKHCLFGYLDLLDVDAIITLFCFKESCGNNAQTFPYRFATLSVNVKP